MFHQSPISERTEYKKKTRKGPGIKKKPRNSFVSSFESPLPLFTCRKETFYYCYFLCLFSGKGNSFPCSGNHKIWRRLNETQDWKYSLAISSVTSFNTEKETSISFTYSYIPTFSLDVYVSSDLSHTNRI